MVLKLDQGKVLRPQEVPEVPRGLGGLEEPPSSAEEGVAPCRAAKDAELWGQGPHWRATWAKAH